MFSDNRFTADSITVHTERLMLMQQNFAVHASTFQSMSPEPVLWAATCHSQYREKRYTVSHLDAQVKATGEAARLSFRSMKQDYMAVREFARQLYAAEQEKMFAHRLNLPYPTKELAQLELVSSLLLEQSKRVAAGDALLIPPALITQLTSSFEAAKLALTAKSNARTEANHARLLLHEQHKTDIQNLKLLYSFSSAMWKDDDIRFNDLGFARPEQTVPGGKSILPKAPSAIRLTSAGILVWDAVSGATSYAVSVSADGGEEWTPDVTTQTNSATVRTEPTGKLYYRVRTRNANGYGEYSVPLGHLFGLPAPEDISYDQGQISWSEVEFADSYEVERASVGSSTYIRVYTGSDTTAFDTPPSGTTNYRIRAISGSVKGEWGLVGV
ncbi:MAG: fibronectin type III domain-containing protein [Candidatus Kapaibacterium sp.]